MSEALESPLLTDAPLTFAVAIPRDLAVQFVGSDGGKRRRFKPTSAITSRATHDDVRILEIIMQEFLESEVRRVHDKARSLRIYNPSINEVQARVLKASCIRYAQHLRRHWKRQGRDPRQARTKERLDQSLSVIKQINLFLNEQDDGRSLQDQGDDLQAGIAEVHKQLREIVTERAVLITDPQNDEERLLRIAADLGTYLDELTEKLAHLSLA